MLKITYLFHKAFIFLMSLRFTVLPLSILFLGISIGIAIALYYIFKSSVERRKVEISLDKLSFLWKNTDEISSVLKKEIIEEIKQELGIKSKTRSNSNSRLIIKPDGYETLKKDAVNELNDEINIKSVTDKELLSLYNDFMPYFETTSEEYNNLFVKLVYLLDKKGSCPSVASSGNDLTNKAYKTNMTIIKNTSQYDVYKRISLIEHTVRVCRKAQVLLQDKIKERNEQKAFVVPSIIACIAHDIGKIPDFSVQYATGEHPVISSRLLLSLGLRSEKSDIFQAVLNHHKVLQDNKNMVYIVLKQADHDARSQELMDFVNSNDKGPADTLSKMGLYPDSNNTPESPDPSSQQNSVSSASLQTDNSDISSIPVSTPNYNTPPDVKELFRKEEQEPDSAIPVNLDFLSSTDNNNNNEFSWLDVENYLGFLKNYINTFNIDTKTGTGELKINSVALTSGSIFFSNFTLGKALTDYMKSINQTPLHYEKDKEQFQEALNYIVKVLLEQSLLDARINKAHYSNTLEIVMKNATIIQKFGVLIKYNAFGFNAINETLPTQDELKNVSTIAVTKDKIKAPEEENADIYS